MASLGVALGLLSLWAVGLSLVGAYWVRKERRCAENRRKSRQIDQPRLPFDSEYAGMLGEHSVRR
jgi:hypothetical protein